MIHVCVPVLKRYDLLGNLLVSLRNSTVPPASVFVIDNGRDKEQVQRAAQQATCAVEIITPSAPMGVAESWNWFIKNVPEERVICNDDILFATGTLKTMELTDEDIVFAEGCGFSCFLIRDACVDKLGLFDEKISPGYGYYEDCDYLQRLDGRGTREASARSVTINCGAVHLKSQTLAANTISEMHEHHRRFKIAQQNYMRKWKLAHL